MLPIHEGLGKMAKMSIQGCHHWWVVRIVSNFLHICVKVYWKINCQCRLVRVKKAFRWLRGPMACDVERRMTMPRGAWPRLAMWDYGLWCETMDGHAGWELVMPGDDGRWAVMRGDEQGRGRWLEMTGNSWRCEAMAGDRCDTW
jgi:hypothetical protein